MSIVAAATQPRAPDSGRQYAVVANPMAGNARQSRYVYDVFVSYSHADQDWVRHELLPHLDASGLRICIDFRDFRAGTPSVLDMERAVQRSRKTLVVLSPAYVDSAWAEYESLMLQTLDPGNKQLRLIPLRKAPCEIPLRLRYLTYVDFVEPDKRQIAWTQLLTALGASTLSEPPAEPARSEWLLAHPYPMPANFTGRDLERRSFSQWLDTDREHPLLVVRALGGFGKSALAWHWLVHDVEPTRWPQALWWSFYEGDATLDGFLRCAVAYVGGDRYDTASMGPRQLADALLRLLRRPGTLLVLDGFERALLAYGGMTAAYQGDSSTSASLREPVFDADCVSPVAEYLLRALSTLPGLQGKVLLTTRLRPRALEAHGTLLTGCQELELAQMDPAEAIAFLLAQGVRGSQAELAQVCGTYGGHPLSLRLLSGLIIQDLLEPGDIAAARRLDVGDDLIQRRHHVLKQAYEQLTVRRRRLLSHIAAFRGAVPSGAIQAISEERPGVDLNGDMRDLLLRGLLQRDRRTGRLDLHPIVRRYAYDRLSARARTTIHGRMRDYFAAVPPPRQIASLDDLGPLIELYHHTVRSGRYEEARELYHHRLLEPIFYRFCAYQVQVDLLREFFPNGEESASPLKNLTQVQWVLNSLAAGYTFLGQPRRSLPVMARVKRINEEQHDRHNFGSTLVNTAIAQVQLGMFKDADDTLRTAITFTEHFLPWPRDPWGHDDTDGMFQNGLAHRDLGWLLALRGQWEAAWDELNLSSSYFDRLGMLQSLQVNWVTRGWLAILQARTAAAPEQVGEKDRHLARALGAAQAALRLARQTETTWYPHQRDYIEAYCLMGATCRMGMDLVQADQYLAKALTSSRQVSSTEQESRILVELARLRVAQGEHPEGRALAEEALVIGERNQLVLSLAEAHLCLADSALIAGDASAAVGHAQDARRLATCDGPPDYTYRVVYDRASARAYGGSSS